MNTTSLNNRVIAAVAGIFIAFFGLTACNSAGSTAPIAAFDAASDNSALALNSLGMSASEAKEYADVNSILTDMQSEMLDEITLGRRNPRGAGGEGGLNAPPRDTNAVRPEATLEISRKTGASGSTSGAAASARFNSALGVQGVNVSVLGANYTLVTPPLRAPNLTPPPQRPNSTNANARPNSTNANAQRPQRIAETLFVFPLPPSSTATSQPTLIALMDANALATFTVRGYSLGETTIDIPGKIVITSAKEGDALPRTAALTVRWSALGSFTNGIVSLRNVPDSAALAGLSRMGAEARIRALPRPIVKTLSAGATSIEFSAAEMAALQAGNAHLSVSVANVKRTNSDKAVLKADSHTGLRLRLQ